MSISKLSQKINNGNFDKGFIELYLDKKNLALQRKRYLKLLENFSSLFGDRSDIRFFSAPGRTEICGNHTDHNRGKVLAAAVNLDAIAAAAKNNENTVKIKSAEYPDMDVIDLGLLTPLDKEAGKSIALIRGICARFSELGYRIGGFDASTSTQVLSGSGVSSSAAFEILVATIMNYLYNDGKISPVEIAKISQYAENNFFKKPCGLMDQTACAVGGFVAIDFEDAENPVITPIDFDFSSSSHALCILDTKASHSDLTDEYASIRSEMEYVAKELGGITLRDISLNDFYEQIPRLRSILSERAVMRAMHFFDENTRVDLAVKALKDGNFEAFKKLVIESGLSSYMYNQNVYSTKQPLYQPVSLALALSHNILKDKGAWRVHGGGFAGTIQAFVPIKILKEYKEKTESVFGDNTCYVLSIRPLGGVELNQN